MVDAPLDPAETREVICNALDAAATKHLERPWRKHGVPPV
jgi:acetyl-CoA carboxylase carboxyltransferase component